MSERDPEAGDAERGTRRWTVRAVGLVRAAQLLPWLTVLSAGRWETYRDPRLIVILYVADMAWAVLLFGYGLRRQGFSGGWVLLDVIITAGCVLMVGSVCKPGYATSWQNWTTGPAMGSAVLATLYCGWRIGLVAAGVLSLIYAVGARADLGEPTGLGALLANLTSLAAFTVAAGLVVSRLRVSARAADDSAVEAVRARRAEAAAEARLEERTRQYRLLHDNVLTTLTWLGQGTDRLSQEMRERCKMDETFLRALISTANDASPDGLNAALGRVASDQSLLGLQVQQNHDDIAQDLPADVVAAVSQAVKEALNNVLKHAGTREARVVATGDQQGGVVVTVADQGRGFDVATTCPGRGIGESLRRRMVEVGGRVDIDSFPGEGTYVEIRWPA